MRVRASSLNYRDLMVLKGGVVVGPSSASCRSATAPATVRCCASAGLSSR
jgi:hypothetical protein